MNYGKTPAVAYYTRKIRTTDRIVLLDQLDRAPLRKNDRRFMFDVIEGLTYKELAEKYNKSESRIYSWKRELFEKLTLYDRQNTTH